MLSLKIDTKTKKQTMTASEKQRCEPEINNMSHLWPGQSSSLNWNNAEETNGKLVLVSTVNSCSTFHS